MDNYIEVILSKGFSCKISIEDADLAEYKWHALSEKMPYAARGSGSKNRTRQLMHRIIAERMFGKAAVDRHEIDHINLDKTDNRRSNLRLSTRSQNQANTRGNPDTPAGLKGVTYHRRDKRYQAEIKVDGQRHYLGYFKTAEKAHEAYMAAARKYFGEYCREK